MKKFSLSFALILFAVCIVSCTKTEYITVVPEEEVDYRLSLIGKKN